ncbi:MAG TPA: MipA/OmpV family protein [Acidiferrobacter sp.]|nr:MipA/OmpV family protein [Acidiferrobacter sp.]
MVDASRRATETTGGKGIIEGVVLRARRRGLRAPRLMLALVGVLFISRAWAQETRSQLGIGLAMFTAPVYPGSDTDRLFAYPYPYWDYESPILHLHHEHLRAKFLRDSRIIIGFGLNGSPPVTAGFPGARAGMPALPPTVALGPSVLYRLRWRPWGLESFVGAESRYRIAINSDWHIGEVGTSASGFVDVRSVHGRPWPISISIGPVWRTHEENNYFFGVPSAYATASRAAYQAPGGYAGIRMTAAISTQWQNMSFTIFGRYRNYSGAAFAASPLLKASNTIMVGVAVVWVFMRSVHLDPGGST